MDRPHVRPDYSPGFLSGNLSGDVAQERPPMAAGLILEPKPAEARIAVDISSRLRWLSPPEMHALVLGTTAGTGSAGEPNIKASPLFIAKTLGAAHHRHGKSAIAE